MKKVEYYELMAVCHRNANACLCGDKFKGEDCPEIILKKLFGVLTATLIANIAVAIHDSTCNSKFHFSIGGSYCAQMKVVAEVIEELVSKGLITLED